jgi:multidrug efflux pump subunit AcrA (membrane-fusion protein)
LEDLVGQNVVTGAKVMDVIDSSHAEVQVAVDESELALLQAGNRASVKLESFPMKTFPGTLVLVSPTSVPEGERRVFLAKLDVANDDGLLRSGMQGWGKISVGWHPAGYVFFRDEGIWFWSKVWSMFGS